MAVRQAGQIRQYVCDAESDLVSIGNPGIGSFAYCESEDSGWFYGASGWTQTSAGGSGSGAISQVIVPIAYDTAGLVTTGVVLTTPAAGEYVLYDSFWDVLTGWNGTTPTAHVGTAADHNKFMAGTTAGTIQMLNFAQHVRMDGSTAVRAFIDNGSGVDPGSSQGEGEIRLFIAAAS